MGEYAIEFRHGKSKEFVRTRPNFSSQKKAIKFAKSLLKNGIVEELFVLEIETNETEIAHYTRSPL